MLLELLPLSNESITQKIVESEITKSAFSSLYELVKPALAIVGGLIGVYIIIKAIQLILNYQLKAKIEAIDEKTDDILEILKRKKSKQF